MPYLLLALIVLDLLQHHQTRKLRADVRALTERIDDMSDQITQLKITADELLADEKQVEALVKAQGDAIAQLKAQGNVPQAIIDTLTQAHQGFAALVAASKPAP